MKRSLWSLLVVAVLLLGASATAHASHELGGTINWRLDSSTATTATYKIHVEAAFRWSFPWAVPAGGHPVVGDTIIDDGPGFVFSYGAPTAPASARTQVNVPFVVSTLNLPNDSLNATGDVSITVPLASLPVTFRFDDCCRASTLADGNADGNFSIETLITNRDGATRSPKSITAPRIYGTAGEPLDFILPIVGADGLPTQVRLATSLESGLTAMKPTGFDVTSAGRVTWSPTVKGLYAVQFTVENSTGARIPLDVVFDIAAASTPHLSFGAGFCGSTISTNVGLQSLTPFSVTSPVSNDPILISTTALPPSTVVQFSGSSGQVSWTPGLGDPDASACFQANGQTSGLRTLGNCCVTFHVAPIVLPPPPCGAATMGNLVLPDYASTSKLLGGASVGAGGALVPLDFGTGPHGGIVWLGSAPQKYANGFSLKFKFTLKKDASNLPTDGFAFVVQSSGLGARGGDGSGLGYAGISRSLAVEFDTRTDSSQGDPLRQHLSAHSRYANPNSASETFALGMDPGFIALNFDNGSTHDIRIEYRPADPAAGPSSGWLRTYVNKNIAPVMEAQIDDAAFAAALGSSAYYGFTAATGAATDEQLQITNVELLVSEAASARVETPPTPVAPGATGELVVEALDPCGYPMRTGGDAGLFVASLTNGPTTVPATVVDNGDGTYAIRYTPPTPGSWHLNVSLNGIPVDGGPFDVPIDTTPVDQPPVLSGVPADVVVEATGASTTVSWSSPSAIDPESGPVPVSCSPASGGAFSVGTVAVTCVASDPAGHVATASFNVTVQDTLAPTLAPMANVVAEATSHSGAVVTYAPSATDLVDGVVPATCTPASGSTIALGSILVACKATDAHGNVGATTFFVSVRDTTPPALVVGPDVVVEATSPSGATATYAPPTANDLFWGDVSGAVHCSPASGSTFALGTTNVSCTVSDPIGNTSVGGFKVTVFDSTGPVLPPLPDVVVEATGASGALVLFAVPPASDAVEGPVPVTCLPGSGNVFPLGETLVSCMASDVPGNVSTKTFKVTVVDTTAPLLVLPGTLAAEATGPAGAAVSFTAAAVDAVDGAAAVTCSPASGSTFPLGTTLVSCATTDLHGNTAVSGFAIVVRDTTAPALANVPGAQVVSATGAGGAVVTFGAPTATDLVDGPVAVTCTPASGSTFPLGQTTVTCGAHDAAGNAASASFTVTVGDKNGPVFGATPSPKAFATSTSGVALTYTPPTAVDAIDGPRPVTCTPASGSTFAVGATTVTCTSSDTAGNTTTATFTVTVTYQAPTGGSFFQQPVNGDGSSIFKLGSTVPVKFALTGASANITNLVAKLYVAKVSNGIEGTLVEATTNGAADAGNQFRYSGGQYIFNLSTKTLSTGTWVVKADLGDGVDHSVHISLR